MKALLLAAGIIAILSDLLFAWALCRISAISDQRSMDQDGAK